ncbi:MAG: pilin [Candidatus Berkelbacteria bacterium]|nr:pilin [Candidatus Berkelbacteria bacterium]
MLGLDDLTNKLNNAITSGSSSGSTGTSSSDALFKATGDALISWISTKVFSLIIGVSIFITLLFTFYGAFLYFTAYGDENKAKQAKLTMVYAIVGFAIVMSGLGIASYVQRSLISKQAEQVTAPVSTGTGAQTGSSSSSDPIGGNSSWGP